MGRFNGNYVENPEAYAAAITRRVKANANTTRRRKLEAVVANDDPDFIAWLFDRTPAWLEALRVTAQTEFDVDHDERSSAQLEYKRAWKEHHERVGRIPEALAKALEDWGGLTDKQLAWARDAFARNIARYEQRNAKEQERKSNAPAWVAGRQEVTGVVQSSRWETFGVNRWHSTTSLKALLLLADGRKLWTSIPARLHPTDSSVDLKGTEVTIKVTVEPARDDATMGFGKRPS